jgi:EpsI family protein
VLAVVAYRPLVTVHPRVELAQELELFLMMPSETSAAVVVAFSAWLLYRRRRRLALLPPQAGPVWLTGLLFAAGLGLQAWATYTRATDLMAFSLMLNGFGIGNLFWGLAGLRVLALPLGFLVFAVPVPGALLNAVVYRFQLWTADLTGGLLYGIGLPAFVSGDQILREGDSFTIVEGCSGLRSVETLTMLSVLMVDLFRRRGWHAVALVAAAPPLAFVLNGWRAVFLIINPLGSTTVVHNAQGIAILLGGVLLLFGLDGLLGRFLPERPPPRPPPKGSTRLTPARRLVATAVFAATAVVIHTVPSWEPPEGGVPRLNGLIPDRIAGWQSRDLDTDYAVFLGRVGFSETLERRYWRQGEAVDLFVGVSNHASRLRAPLSPKTRLPGSGWIVEEAGRESLDTIGKEVDFLVLRSGTRRVLVHHWRQGADGILAESLRSLMALDQSPFRRSRHTVVVRTTTEMGAPSPQNRRRAEERLARFSAAISGALDPLGTAGKDFPVFPELGKPFPQLARASNYKTQ